MLAYVSIARGFKGGDFNGGALFGPAEANIVDPEYVTAYEVGVKGSTPDRRVSFDTAAFYYDFTNQQVSVMVPGSDSTLQQLSNAAKTTSKGIEADVSVLPLDQLYVDGKIGLLDSRFDRFQLDPSNPATNYAGNRTALSPKFSFAGARALYRADSRRTTPSRSRRTRPTRARISSPPTTTRRSTSRDIGLRTPASPWRAPTAMYRSPPGSKTSATKPISYRVSPTPALDSSN